jgi:hypothetical protein
MRGGVLPKCTRDEIAGAAELDYAGRMIHGSQLAAGLAAGIAAIVFGLVPGMAQSFVDGFLRLSDTVHVRMFQLPRQSRLLVRVDQPVGFALFGLAIIAVTLLAYLRG